MLIFIEYTLVSIEESKELRAEIQNNLHASLESELPEGVPARVGIAESGD
jgi:hypothetical protein